jgi:hypothetical protein
MAALKPSDRAQETVRDVADAPLDPDEREGREVAEAEVLRSARKACAHTERVHRPGWVVA